MTATYEKSNGKFSSIYGNVVIIDCIYFFDDLIEQIEQWAKDNIPKRYRDDFIDKLNNLKAYLDNNQLSACDFPYEVDGVLKDQADYYVKQYKQIDEEMTALT